jgi:hypothetical protein
MQDEALTITSSVLCRPGGREPDDRQRFDTTLAELTVGIDLDLEFVGSLRLIGERAPWAEATNESQARFVDKGFRMPEDTIVTLSGELGQPSRCIAAFGTSDEWTTIDDVARVCADEVSKSTQDLFFSMNIARPGAVQLIDSRTSVGSYDVQSRTQYPHYWDLARYRAEAGGWPVLRELTLPQVWSWLRGVSGFSAGFARNAVGRAVQAMSHLLEPNDPVVELLWTMIGLEALFTSGEAGMVQQLRERAAALLGANALSNKLISDMYRIRSKFIHGKMNFAGAYHHQDGADEFEKTEEALNDALHIGRAVLLAAIQELIVRDWRDVEFVTTVRGSRAPTV